MRNPRLLFLLGSVVSFTLVLAGLLMARYMNLAACPLCIWQRMFYLAFGLLALLGLLVANHHSLRRLVSVLMAIAAATGGGVAGYQVWIQRFAPMTTCAGKEAWWEAVIRVAGEHVPLLFEASGLCSDPAWKFLDLSIADWSLLAFTGLTALSIYIVAASPRRRWR